MFSHGLPTVIHESESLCFTWWRSLFIHSILIGAFAWAVSFLVSAALGDMADRPFVGSLYILAAAVAAYFGNKIVWLNRCGFSAGNVGASLYAACLIYSPDISFMETLFLVANIALGIALGSLIYIRKDYLPRLAERQQLAGQYREQLIRSNEHNIEQKVDRYVRFNEFVVSDDADSNKWVIIEFALFLMMLFALISMLGGLFSSLLQTGGIA